MTVMKIKKQRMSEEQSHIIHKSLLLKLQYRDRTEKHNLFTEKFDKITLSANDYKRIQRIDSRKNVSLWYKQKT